jgi:hypothetical protein
MPNRVQKPSPALKHGAYSEATLLPGEDPDEFEELHRGLIAEFRPNGRFEEETVATIARLMWRRQNLAQFELGQLAYFLFEQIKKAVAKKTTKQQDDELTAEFEKILEASEEAQNAPKERQQEAQLNYFEISKTAALTRLLKELDVEERLDSMIDRLIKRLLFVRGLKSLPSPNDPQPPGARQEPRVRKLPGPQLRKSRSS